MTNYDFGARMYDPRVGRYFSNDPKEIEYSWQALYAYHRNTPVTRIDFYGEGDTPEKIDRYTLVKRVDRSRGIEFDR